MLSSGKHGYVMSLYRFRLHGTENLLHRAAAGGSVPVVSELLKCGYRNIAAKDHDGQCAMHLAAFFGHVDVLGKLKSNNSNE